MGNWAYVTTVCENTSHQEAKQPRLPQEHPLAQRVPGLQVATARRHGVNEGLGHTRVPKRMNYNSCPTQGVRTTLILSAVKPLHCRDDWKISGGQDKDKLGLALACDVSCKQYNLGLKETQCQSGFFPLINVGSGFYC